MSHARFQIQPLIKLGGVFIILGIFFSSRSLLQDTMAEFAPIKYVQVEGVFQYIDKRAIQKKIDPLAQLGYFSANLQEIQRSVKNLPWTDNVQVQRIWPDGLKLRIYEQQPVVRWQADHLLSVHGDIFKPTNIDKFQVLPLLDTPIDQRHELLQVMEGLGVSLLDQGLHLIEFSVSHRQSWRLVMENGLIIQLGRLDPLQKFTQLMQTFMVLGYEKVEKISYLDMRYPNGYAVQWRKNEQVIWK